MNEIAQAEQGKKAVSVSDSTRLLIRSGVSENTIQVYGRALANLSEWLDDRVEAFHIDNGDNGLYRPHDAALAEYITALHEAGKSPSTIPQAVAAVKWRFGENSVGEITKKTLAGIRRAGKERSRGQVQGLTWQEVKRVCSFAEASKTLAVCVILPSSIS